MPTAANIDTPHSEPSPNPWSRVSVVVVTHHSAAVIAACLAEIGASAEVILVDNASDDDTLDIVTGITPRAKIRRNKTGVGYGAGANQGLSEVSRESLRFWPTRTHRPTRMPSPSFSRPPTNTRMRLYSLRGCWMLRVLTSRLMMWRCLREETTRPAHTRRHLTVRFAQPISPARWFFSACRLWRKSARSMRLYSSTMKMMISACACAPRDIVQYWSPVPLSAMPGAGPSAPAHITGGKNSGTWPGPGFISKTSAAVPAHEIVSPGPSSATTP